MNQSQIESHLQDWVVKSKGEYGVFGRFEYTKGPFIQFCADTDQGHIYFTAIMPMCRGGPTGSYVYDFSQLTRAKIVQEFKKITATHDLEVELDEKRDSYTISEMNNVETLVECVRAIMNVMGDAYGEMKFKMF